MASGQCHDRPERLPVLDGLRGLAVLAVVIGHSANYGLLPAVLGGGFGQIGVGVFFVLSGFLMAWLYALRPFTGAEIRTYLIQRIFRVMPLYVLVVLVAATLLDILPESPYRFSGPGDVIAALSLQSGTGVLWSVPVEMHFYLVFIGIWFAASRGRAALFMGGLLLTGIAASISLYGRGIGPQLLPFWLHFFLAGSAIGLWLAKNPGRLTRLAAHPWAGLFAWGLLLAAPLASPGFRVAVLGWDVSPTYRDPISVAFPILFLAAGLAGRGPFALLAAAPLRRLGAISFGVYLLHPVAIRAVAAIPGIPAPLDFPLVLAASFTAATLSFRLIESPVLGSAQNAAGRPLRALGV